MYVLFSEICGEMPEMNFAQKFKNRPNTIEAIGWSIICQIYVYPHRHVSLLTCKLHQFQEELTAISSSVRNKAAAGADATHLRPTRKWSDGRSLAFK